MNLEETFDGQIQNLLTLRNTVAECKKRTEHCSSAELSDAHKEIQFQQEEIQIVRARLHSLQHNFGNVLLQKLIPTKGTFSFVEFSRNFDNFITSITSMGIQNLEPLMHLEQLQHIDIDSPFHLTLNFPSTFWKKLPNVTFLSLTNINNDESNVFDFRESNLRTVVLSTTMNVRIGTELLLPNTLEEITLSTTDQESLESLSTLPHLQSIYVIELMTKLTDLDLETLKNIQTLSFNECRLESLSWIQKLPNITNLSLINLSEVHSLDPLKNLLSLTNLKIDDPYSTDHNFLLGCSNLHTLNLHNFRSLDLACVLHTPLVEILDLKYSTIINIHHIHSLKNLVFLNLQNYSSIQSILSKIDPTKIPTLKKIKVSSNEFDKDYLNEFKNRYDIEFLFDD